MFGKSPGMLGDDDDVSANPSSSPQITANLSPSLDSIVVGATPPVVCVESGGTKLEEIVAARLLSTVSYNVSIFSPLPNSKIPCKSPVLLPKLNPAP